MMVHHVAFQGRELPPASKVDLGVLVFVAPRDCLRHIFGGVKEILLVFILVHLIGAVENAVTQIRKRPPATVVVQVGDGALSKSAVALVCYQGCRGRQIARIVRGGLPSPASPAAATPEIP